MQAINPETSIVINPAVTRTGCVCIKKTIYFSNKKTPAVTRVLLWTKAETGVGALIAIGSQLLKGTWALLVKAPNTMTSGTRASLYGPL
jgi:hypothetical protein